MTAAAFATALTCSNAVIRRAAPLVTRSATVVLYCTEASVPVPALASASRAVLLPRKFRPIMMASPFRSGALLALQPCEGFAQDGCAVGLLP